MEHPFSNVFFTERCNACGGAYQVTLYDIYRQQQLADEWQSARPDSGCDDHQLRLVTAISKDALAAAMEAWERLAATLNERGLTYDVSGNPRQHVAEDA